MNLELFPCADALLSAYCSDRRPRPSKAIKNQSGSKLPK